MEVGCTYNLLIYRGYIGIMEKKMETTMVYSIRVIWDYWSCTYKLLSNRSYNPISSRVIVVVGLIFGI